MARFTVVLLAVFAFTAVAPAAADAAPRKCKRGYVLKTVTKNGKKVKRCVKKRPKQPPAGQDAPQTQPEAPGGGADPAPAPTQGQPLAPSQVTRNDEAGQQAMSNAGDLLLERYEEGGTYGFSIYRIWLLGDGTFKYVEVYYNREAGESCTTVKNGTWVFKEGYTFSESGGGTVVRVTITFTDGQSGDDLVTFANQDPNAVYVGTKGLRFDRNPNMRNSC